MALALPVPFSQLQQVKAILHAFHFSLMDARHKHPGVALPDLQVLILGPQQVLCSKHEACRKQVTALGQSGCVLVQEVTCCFLLMLPPHGSICIHAVHVLVKACMLHCP